MIRQVMRVELKKYLIELKTYYADHLVGMAMTVIIFSVFALSSPSSRSSFYIGFVYWYLLSSLVTESSTTISMEKQMGTLEQLLIKPIPFELLITIKTMVWYGVNVIKVGLVLLLLSLIWGIQFSVHWLLLPVFLLASLGIFGFTLVLVALTLKYTKTASFESLISYGLLFLTGAVVPQDNLPTVIQWLANTLPMTHGIRISRHLLDNGQLSIAELLQLGLQSLVYLAVGYALFLMIYKNSKKSGIDRNY